MDKKIKRLVASVIDFYIICFLSSGVIGIVTLGSFDVTTFTVVTYLILCFLLITLKDCVFKNASIGKKLLKLKVVKNDGTNPQFADLLKRNIPIVILLPIEILVMIISVKRIGDIWSKTEVV